MNKPVSVALSPFVSRHIGPRDSEIQFMLSELGYASLDDLTHAVVPANIADNSPMDLLAGISEFHWTRLLRHIHSESDPTKRTRESRLVYRLHSLSARDLARSLGIALLLSNHGLRTDRHGHFRSVAVGRGYRSSGSHDALPTILQIGSQPFSSFKTMPSSDN